MLTFQDAFNSIDEGERPSILLANGFSQAWDSSIFNYANLLEAADFGERNSIIDSLFERMETYDFELIMRQLVSAELVLDIYGTDAATLKQIQDDKEILKEALITAISNTHPDLPSDVSDDQYVAVRKFLIPFNEIFTLNYDLLFYWARNKDNLQPDNYSTDDGFRAQRRWEGYSTDQEVHFLHGGLHIYDSLSFIKKHAYKENGETIIDQVRENLDNGKFPLFVSEPTDSKKKNKIERNPYLNYCYQSLRKLNGTLFIYGHSMDENDKHIFDQINLSNVHKIFVSVFGNESTDANKRSKANAKAYLESAGVEVHFYQAESAPVWA